MNKLIEAIQKNDVDTCKLLLQNGEDVNARDEYSETALNVAVFFGYANICELLLQHGAEVNARSATTALHIATYYGYANICELLIQHGADVNARDKDGRTALNIAADYDDMCEISLHQAAHYSRTALHYAAQRERADICKILLQNGADAADKNN